VSAAFYSGLRFLSMLFIKLLIGSENASRPVSRVLSLKMVIYLVRLSPADSSQPTRWLSGPPQRHLFGLASDGVYIASGVAVGPVVSYTAISPLPLRAVSFLLHLSWDRSRQTLSGILPCEARTFLTCYWRDHSVNWFVILSCSFKKSKCFFLFINRYFEDMIVLLFVQQYFVKYNCKSKFLCKICDQFRIAMW